MTKELLISALKEDICHTQTTEGCIMHSDREASTALWIVNNMSRKGNCWANEPMESFWGKLKQEWTYEQYFRTREEARAEEFEYIWIFYYRKRIHEANGYLTSEE